jgi:NAD(P)-dependent dehydrogenase (short-subunit alcohol dehydrogenase family)
MLTDKVCIVTGAGSGIGRATALEMSRQGARAVVVSDVDDAAGRAVADEVAGFGAEGAFVHCDVSSGSDVRALMAEVGDAYGVLDVLHNNAGIVDAQLTDARTVYDIDEGVWDRIFDVNVKGSWLCIKYGKPLLAKSRAGVVLNCASISSFVHFEAESAYVASKSAILGLTRTAAVDLAPFGVRCVAYAPGTIDTPMNTRIWEQAEDQAAMERALTATHLVPRLGAPEDIAKFVCFLASDDASFTTGSVHVIDGGALAWRGTAA